MKNINPFDAIAATMFITFIVCAFTATSTWTYQVYKEQARLDLQMECK